MIPYESHNNQIGVRLPYLLIDDDRRHTQSVMQISYEAYKGRVKRDPALRLRAGGGPGTEVLLKWEGLPVEWKDELVKRFGQPVKEQLPLEAVFGIDAAAKKIFEDFTFDDGKHLTQEQIRQYTMNASLLRAVDALRIERETMRKRCGGSSRDIWPSVYNDFIAFQDALKQKYSYTPTIAKSSRRLRVSLSSFKTKDGWDYKYLIDGRARNQSAAKIKDEKQKAMVEELLRKHQNFDNEQIALFYNTAAPHLGWKMISASTVAIHRKALDLYVYSGQRGETNFRHTRSMQAKRNAPTSAMTFWTIDGWTAELLYQKFEDGSTTYHNRLTVVVVLDPVGGIKYPIGYAIGTHETPTLITEALRNAANHTRELFGQRFYTHQLQSDNYSIKTLEPIYEAISKHFTPARVKNSKAKVIEPYFLSLNRLCQKFFGGNWSGFGKTADKENQPNDDYLNKIRHSFPDEAGCRAQIVKLMEAERATKRNDYMERWNALPEADRLPLATDKFLYYFGDTHSHTIKLRGEGLTPTLLGEEKVYDSFDPRFRECAFMDWAIKYDPSDLSSVLVLNAKCDKATSKLKEITGTFRFELNEKYVQPMALYDRKDGDAAELAKLHGFNKKLEQSVIDRGAEKRRIVEELFIHNPQLNDTLTKMVLTDSNGQHKDVKSRERIAASTSSATKKQLPPSPPDDFEIIDDVRNQY